MFSLPEAGLSVLASQECGSYFPSSECEGLVSILDSSLAFGSVSFLCGEDYLRGFGSLDFHDLVFQTSKPEHAVKLKREIPIFDSMRYRNAAGNSDPTE